MTAAITISLDFEAGWGVVGNGGWRQREAQGVYRDLRPVLKRFVRLLDTLEIPCIWAVVGAMIDPPEKRDLSHLKGTYGQKARRFLAEAETMTHDGRDLLDIVLTAKSPQVFGTHGYSHVLFDDPEQDSLVYRAELERALVANATASLASDFFVFPQNRVGHLDVVAKAGIKVARTPPANAPAPGALPGPISRAIGSLLRPISPVVDTTLDNGLHLHAGSELLNWGTNGGWAKAALVRRRNRRALDTALAGNHVHYWLHPFDLVATKGLMQFSERLLIRAARARDAGHLEFRAEI